MAANERTVAKPGAARDAAEGAGPHVVQVIAPQPAGGAESVVRAWATGAVRSGRRATVLALVDGAQPHPLVESMRSAGVPVETVQCGRRRYRAEVREIGRRLRALGADLVHSHIYHADVVGYWAARSVGIPQVCTVHGLTGTGWRNQLYLAIDRWVLRRAAAVVCVSDALRQWAIAGGCRPDAVHMIPNAYAADAPCDRDTARERLGLRPGGLAVGWVGRLSHEKGPDLMVDAVAPLVGEGVQAVLIGDGPARAEVEHQIVGAGVAPDGIRVLGRVDEAAALLRAFDVLVVSSRTEANPMIILEAMAVGVPLVSFAVGGVPAVLDEEYAWLVPPEDPHQLREAIGAALDRADARHIKAERARRVLENRYGIDQWLNRLDGVYARALGRPALGEPPPVADPARPTADRLGG